MTFSKLIFCLSSLVKETKTVTRKKIINIKKNTNVNRGFDPIFISMLLEKSFIDITWPIQKKLFSDSEI